MAPRKKGQGGKLNRSEIVQTRLSPKSRYAAEIMARQQRRTLSSIMEHLVEETAKTAEVEVAPIYTGVYGLLPPRNSEYQTVTVVEAVELTWHDEEHTRFVAMAGSMPSLLTPVEQSLWALIQATDYFWTYYRVDTVDEQGNVVGEHWFPHELIPEHLQQYWEKMTCGKSFNIGELPHEMGRKIDRPAGVPATMPSFAGKNDYQELDIDADDPVSDPEFWEMWAQEIIKHSTEETEIQQGKDGAETIKKYYLPSMEKQKELMKKAMKIWEKKHGA